MPIPKRAAIRNANVGASAAAVPNTPNVARQGTSTRLRPKRSASTPITGAMKMPGKDVAAISSPAPESRTPNSSRMSGIAGASRVLPMIPVPVIARISANSDRRSVIACDGSDHPSPSGRSTDHRPGMASAIRFRRLRLSCRGRGRNKDIHHMNDNIRIPVAEALGTAVLVIGGPGTAIFATGGFNEGLNLGILGVSLAFGLSLLCMAYLVGRISGCHINPAVTIGMILAKKLDAAKSVPYFVGQFIGGIVGAGILALTLSGTDGYLGAAQDAGFASNGYGEHSPAGFDLLSVAIIEIVLTAVFVLIVLGTTSTRGVPTGFGPIAAGLGLTLVHLVSIPVSNTSVNPARSLATAVFQGDWALGQVWAFIVFPAVGAVLAGGLWMVLGPNEVDSTASTA